MNHRTLLLSATLVLVTAPVALAEPFDGMTMRVNRGSGPGSVTLDWTGGQPTFSVYRSASRQTVLDPGNQIGTTNVRTFDDTPPSGAIFYYKITSPCVYAPPEVCNGLDDDCNGTIDGLGSEVNCQLPHAIPTCAEGACAIFACVPNFGDCDLAPANGCESNLTKDTAHCGSCSINCGDADPCTHDACVNSACAPPVDTSYCLAPDGVNGAGSCAAAEAGCVNTTDDDNDGLNDAWENAGAIDINCDGIYDSNDVTIPDANKKVKDVYLRISYMEASTGVYPVPDPSVTGCPIVSFTEPPGGHKPHQDSVDFVVRAFSGAHLQPAAQPCGKSGDAPCGPLFACVDFACLPLCTSDSDCAPSCNLDCQAEGGARCVRAPASPNSVCRMWRLHVDPLPSAGVPHHDIVTYGQVSPSCTNSNDQVNLFDAKTPGTFDPKEAAFKRFVLFGHDNTCYGEGSPGCGDVSCPLMNGRPAQPKTSGVAEVRGNDAIVSLGILQLQAPPATRIAAEAGALMHELGHNLGLYNGGTLPTGDVPKVNHLSVMDYTYQLSGVPFTDTLGSTAVVGTRPDFAHEPLAQTLDESSLFESAGVGAPAEEPNTKSLVKYMHLHTSVCPCPIDPCTGLAYPSCAAYGAVAGPGGSVPPIDWNCDGVISPVGVTADINGNGTRDVQDPGGTAEWRSLLHDFQCQPSYPDGANGSTEQGAPQR